MMAAYPVFPVGSEVSSAMLETGNPSGFVDPVRSNQAPLPLLTSVATQIWPPAGERGPSPSVPAYITFENPGESFIPPAANVRITFTSPPVQLSLPPVSRLLVRAEKPVPLVAPRHTRQVPTSSSPEFCGSRRNGVKN